MKLIECVQNLQEEKADVCVMKHKEGVFNQLNDYKYVLYRSKLIKRKKFFLKMLQFYQESFFLENVRRKITTSIVWEENSIAFEEMYTLEWFGKIEAGNTYRIEETSRFSRKKYVDNELFENAL